MLTANQEVKPNMSIYVVDVGAWRYLTWSMNVRQVLTSEKRFPRLVLEKNRSFEVGAWEKLIDHLRYLQDTAYIAYICYIYRFNILINTSWMSLRQLIIMLNLNWSSASESRCHRKFDPVSAWSQFPRNLVPPGERFLGISPHSANFPGYSPSSRKFVLILCLTIIKLFTHE